MMKGPLNSKSIDSGLIHSIGDGSIEFGTEGGESHSIIIWADVLLKMGSSVGPNSLSISIDTGLDEKNSQRFRSVIWNWQGDSAMCTTHWKFWILSGRSMDALVFPVKSLAMRAANCQKRGRKWYMMFMGPKEWATFIKRSRSWRASKWRCAGNRLIGSHGADRGAAAARTGLLWRLSGDSVKILLAFRFSSRRCVRGVVGGCICSVGRVVEAIDATSLLQRNLCNVDWLYQLEMTTTIQTSP